MPAKGIHHVDLAVADVERSLTFYLGLLDALGTHAGISAHRPFRASERCDRDARNSRKAALRESEILRWSPERIGWARNGCLTRWRAAR